MELSPHYKRVHGRSSKCTSLRALDLSGNHITVLNGFRSHKSIQELRLQMCPVSDDGLDELAQLTSLTELDLPDDCGCITDAGVVRLAALQFLAWRDSTCAGAPPSLQMRSFVWPCACRVLTFGTGVGHSSIPLRNLDLSTPDLCGRLLRFEYSETWMHSLRDASTCI